MTRQNFLSEKQKQNCKKTLDQMPNEFSSRTFNKVARLIGEPDAWTNSDQSCFFLKFYCTNIKGTKSWKKINNEQNTIIPTTSFLINNLLDFNSEEKESKKILNNIPIETQNCPECGNEFEAIKFKRHHEKKYCSTLCRSRSAWKRRVQKNKLNEIDKRKNVKELILDDINQAIKILVDTGMYKIYIKTEEFKEIN